ncbi:MAG: bifunctional phosphopantothenoylcysteine decarboxylase/phosphopantothenate--cysteine ligase CoaBC [Candidatus Hydrothermarchaeota archaeon]|nr:MAG: bifunctional phosphopantothenoylcysteine decarboxylase/phosphopantothenate--cysteine ligase CoaBC [Candidatus Hydrothermarchaeota archaeon]
MMTKIALCVCGSVAAIKAPLIARELIRRGFEVYCYMTPAACEIVSPELMEFATRQEVVTKLSGKLEHLRNYDVILIAPATANTISKIAHGIADNCVTALILARNQDSKIIVAPAMHANMYFNIQENVEKLKERGFYIVEPILSEGKAKLAPEEEIIDAVYYMLREKDFSNKRILITAGATIEYIDPVRIITNKSSGKMGLAIAKEAYFRGAKVKLILGYSKIKPLRYLSVDYVETSEDMLNAVKKNIKNCDIYISAAAITDFTTEKAEKKIKTKEITIKLKPTTKIFEKIKDEDVIKVGFKALYNVSENELIEEAKEILKKYELDLVVANDVAKDVFGSDENEVYIIDKEGKIKHIKRTKKSEIAKEILNMIKNAC